MRSSPYYSGLSGITTASFTNEFDVVRDGNLGDEVRRASFVVNPASYRASGGAITSPDLSDCQPDR